MTFSINEIVLVVVLVYPFARTFEFNLNRLRAAGVESPAQIKAIPIRDIRLGQRVPAHNPQVTASQRAEQKPSIDASTWRKFTLDVDKADGSGNVNVTLLRPSTWLVDEVEATSLALLDAIVEETAAESSAQPAWLQAIDQIQTSLSATSLLESAGQTLTWANSHRHLVSSGDPLAGLAQLGLGQFCDQQCEDQRIEEDYWDAAEDIQSGSGIGSVVWLGMPELGAVGLATVVANSPYTESDVDQLLVQRGYVENPNPETHRLLRLVAIRDDGSQTRIELICSLLWIRNSWGEEELALNGHRTRDSDTTQMPDWKPHLESRRLVLRKFRFFGAREQEAEQSPRRARGIHFFPTWE